MKVELLKYPTDTDWMEVKRRALVTIGKSPVSDPDYKWKVAMLKARHSPIRFIQFSFYLEVPYWVSVHLTRHHVGCQPYVKTQRNDRQDNYDRTEAPQGAMVSMIWDVNAEALMTIANKRLCNMASPETQQVAKMMCEEVLKVCPEFDTELVPACVRCGKCYEIKKCGKPIVFPEIFDRNERN